MGKARALVNKLKRRRKNANSNRGFRQQDKIDRKDEVLAGSRGAYKFLRGIQRRLDKNFGQQLQPSAEFKPGKEMLVEAYEMERKGEPADRIEALLVAGLVEAIGIQPGDIATILTGALKGRELEVTLVSGDTVTLEDDADLTGLELNVQIKWQISGTKTSHK